MTGRAARSIAAVVAALLLAACGSAPNQALDAIAEAKRRHSIDLESQQVETNGVRLHVVTAGPSDGPTVLLLHGYPEFWWGWNEQIARLQRSGFRVIAPDLRGYNVSAKPVGIEQYRREEIVADVVGLIEHLGGQPVYLAGHDWGGAIAWQVAIEFPERVRKLMIFNAPHPLAFQDLETLPAGEKPTTWFRTFFRLPILPELVTGAFDGWIVIKSLRDSSRPATFTPVDLDLYRQAWKRQDAMHSMINWYRASFQYPPSFDGDGTVALPTRIVWGVEDEYFDARMGHLSLAHCTDARLVELPGAGHWLLHEEPERTSQEMIDFFR